MKFIQLLFDKINFKHVLSIILVIMAFYIFMYVISHNLNESAKQYSTTIIQAIIGFVGVIVGFFFGSSVGSQKKDDIISDLKTNDSTSK